MWRQILFIQNNYLFLLEKEPDFFDELWISEKKRQKFCSTLKTLFVFSDLSTLLKYSSENRNDEREEKNQLSQKKTYLFIKRSHSKILMYSQEIFSRLWKCFSRKVNIVRYLYCLKRFIEDRERITLFKLCILFWHL